MTAMKGSGLLSYIFLLLVMTQAVYGQLYSTSPTIVPPVGNSPAKVVKSVSSYMIYTCVNSAWVLNKGYAVLVDNTTGAVVGNYTIKVDKQGALGTWTLINSPGDAAESGSSASAVAGRSVASYVGTSGSLPEQLMEAASHQNDGEAASVSYIQIYNTVGGLPPAKEKCSSQVYSATVPFKAEFCLWKQDPIPASVPQALAAPGHAVEGFFCKGSIVYKYDGSQWVDYSKVALLYALPGTPALGQYTATNGAESWNIYNPNGFRLYGKRTSPSMEVTPNACPWTLSSITSESGSLMNMGAFTHVQMCSTRGGLAPSSTSDKVAAGTMWSSPFSAIFWLYVST